MHRFYNLDKKNNPNTYFFDKGIICNRKDFDKKGIKVSVMEVDPNGKENLFLVYLLLIIGNKSIPQQLKKTFNNNIDSELYFKELCEFVELSLNREIILKCYNHFIVEVKKKIPKNFQKISN